MGLELVVLLQEELVMTRRSCCWRKKAVAVHGAVRQPVARCGGGAMGVSADDGRGPVPGGAPRGGPERRAGLARSPVQVPFTGAPRSWNSCTGLWASLPWPSSP